MKTDNNWQSVFEGRAINMSVWFGILIIALIAYFIWRSKVALFATSCSVFFFIKNMAIAYFAYVKKDNKDDK